MNTDDFIGQTADILTTAHFEGDPGQRATLLAAAQHMLTWALRQALLEAHNAGMSFGRLTQGLGMPRGVLYRQLASGAGVVAPEVSYTPIEVAVGLRTCGGYDDSWQGLTAEQAADTGLSSVTVDLDGMPVQLRTRPASEEERIGQVQLQPLWRPSLGRRAVLLAEPVAQAWGRCSRERRGPGW